MRPAAANASAASRRRLASLDQHRDHLVVAELAGGVPGDLRGGHGGQGAADGAGPDLVAGLHRRGEVGPQLILECCHRSILPCPPGRRAPAPDPADQITDRPRAGRLPRSVAGRARQRHGTIVGCDHEPSRPSGPRPCWAGQPSRTARSTERNWFALRRCDVPVLPAGRGAAAGAAHLRRAPDARPPPADVLGQVAGRPGSPTWWSTPAIPSPTREAVEPFLDALGPLLDRPGVFVYGSNDLYLAGAEEPAALSVADSSHRARPGRPDLPWAELGAGMTAAGWLDVNNRRGRVKAGRPRHRGGRRARLAHQARPLRRDRRAGGPGADLRLGVMHSPEPAGARQVHRGRLRPAAGGPHPRRPGPRCPGYGALVTNCGIDRERVSGLHRHPAAPPQPAEPDSRPWLHVSAGLGTSPWAPVRFACRPEATLLTLVPRIG